MNDQDGATLAEVLVTALAFAILALALGSFYMFGVRAYAQGAAHAFLGRQAVLVQDELARRLLPAVALPPGPCNGVALPASQQVVSTAGSTLCFYLDGTDRQIYSCTLPSCTDKRNLLGGGSGPAPSDGAHVHPGRCRGDQRVARYRSRAGIAGRASAVRLRDERDDSESIVTTGGLAPM